MARADGQAVQRSDDVLRCRPRVNARHRTPGSGCSLAQTTTVASARRAGVVLLGDMRYGSAQWGDML